MRPSSARSALIPLYRAIAQLDDPTLKSVVVQSVALSVASFGSLYLGMIWAIHRVVHLKSWMAWGADILGSMAASLLALWLFLPVAAVIATIFLDRIARSVERRFYPWLPPPTGESLLMQLWDGIAIGLQVLGLNVMALLLAVVLPGVGLVLGWVIGAYAIGRGLFVAVAMRRLPRHVAESLYRANRGSVLIQGALLALTTYIPIANVLTPVIAIAAMVHVLDMALTAAENSQP